MTHIKDGYNGMSYSLLGKDKWEDFEKVMGKNGAYWGCWCAYDRMRRSLFSKSGSDIHKSVTRKYVDSGKIVGIIAYENEEPIGWCSIGPVEDFPGIMFSRELKPEEPEGKWCITCLFIRKGWRKKGLTSYLITSALDVSRKENAKSVEAYPVEGGKPKGDPFIYRGLLSTYLKLGFVPVRTRSRTSVPVVAYKL